jgi:site-specific DNA-methyltransferase (adenine-specific)
MKEIPENSIDLILTDLPYQISDCKWDERLPLPELWENYNRVKKIHTPVILFSNQPFTTILISSNLKKFRYVWYWLKNNTTGFCFAKNQPMRKVEDICVFYDRSPIYKPQDLKPAHVRKKRVVLEDSVYDSITLEKEYIQDLTGYPHNVLNYETDALGANHFHPTQKPVLLLEYLIKTYTDYGAAVLDSCMGSGSTGVACTNTGRDFIGIEKTRKYFEISVKRIKEAEAINRSNLFDIQTMNEGGKHNPPGGGGIAPGRFF